jgi:endonuclease YncB( thermonuclease family)
MRNNITIIATVSSLLALSPAASAAGDCRVIDGDTLACTRAGHAGRTERIRIWGLDCPEAHTHAGTLATRAARALVEGNRVILVEPYLSDSDRDRHNRLIASVLIQRTSRAEFFTFDFACRMIADGYCIEYVKFSKGYYERCKP